MKTTFLQSSLILFLLIFSVTTSFGVALYPAAGIAANYSDAPATPELIKGPAVVCTGSTVAYSVEPVGGALSYTWTIPNSWTIIAGQGTSQISVAVGSNGGAVSVQAMNNYGASGSRQLQVTIASAPSRPNAIDGPVSLCGASKATYRVQPLIEGMAYNWALPAGWAIVSGQGTGEIEVEATAGKGTISVTAGNMCGQSMPVTLSVSVTPAIMNNLLPASQAICK
ncbi:MAG: hypothetical protein LPK07_09085, partial [Hymenobacteraceae bacterium]|nr:hypothetical protein [Hymenobacteraceae bacterium]MDX5481825.1 hypothetical protein [Hymenobacteraceae bacterium]